MSHSNPDFVSSHPLRIGVEMELQLLDGVTLNLKPIAPELLNILGNKNPLIKPEFFQSMIEVISAVRQNAHELEVDLEETIEQVRHAASLLSVRLASTGAHPFSKNSEGIISDSPRFREVFDRAQLVSRRFAIFGLHVHLGMKSGEECIAMYNAFLPYLHLLLALSASSPFWEGEDSGFASYRATVFEAFPHAGHPIALEDWAQFSTMLGSLQRSEGVSSVKDLWWDLRPRPDMGTLEIRLCDALPTLRETMGMAALIHALAHYLHRNLEQVDLLAPHPDWVLRENKWRCSRFGLEATVIKSEQGETIPVRQALLDLFDMLHPIEQEMGYEVKFYALLNLMNHGGGYGRQRRNFLNLGSLKKVVEVNCLEFETNAPDCAPP